MYINVSNIGQKQVHAVDGFPFPWKISKEKVKKKKLGEGGHIECVHQSGTE